jgi:hypothetical protein
MNISKKIRSVVRNKDLIVVGGERRDQYVQQLKEAFEPSLVEWVSLREQDASPRRFLSRLQRPGVGLVISLIGLVRHQHSRDLRRLCARVGLPLVHCRRSPNPAMVAHSAAQQNVFGRSKPS